MATAPSSIIHTHTHESERETLVQRTQRATITLSSPEAIIMRESATYVRVSRFPNCAPVRIDSWAGARAPARCKAHLSRRHAGRSGCPRASRSYPFVRPPTYSTPTHLSIHPSIHPCIRRPNVCLTSQTRSSHYFRADQIILEKKKEKGHVTHSQRSPRATACRATIAMRALTFLMTINPRTMRGCAMTISDNTFAGRRESESSARE